MGHDIMLPLRRRTLAVSNLDGQGRNHPCLIGNSCQYHAWTFCQWDLSLNNGMFYNGLLGGFWGPYTLNTGEVL